MQKTDNGSGCEKVASDGHVLYSCACRNNKIRMSISDEYGWCIAYNVPRVITEINEENDSDNIIISYTHKGL